jgi:hypothetical protein
MIRALSVYGSTDSLFDHSAVKTRKFARNSTMRGFVEDVRSHSIVPKRQLQKVAREFTALAQDEQFRETFENIRLLRERFEPEEGRRASQAP